MSNAQWVQHLTRYYLCYNPTKLETIPSLVAMFPTEELTLFVSIRSKYEGTDPSRWDPQWDVAHMLLSEVSLEKTHGLGHPEEARVRVIGESVDAALRAIKEAYGQVQVGLQRIQSKAMIVNRLMDEKRYADIFPALSTDARAASMALLRESIQNLHEVDTSEEWRALVQELRTVEERLRAVASRKGVVLVKPSEEEGLANVVV